jgi:fatty-acyl-CoA synthase
MAAVIGVPDEKWGEKVVAVVVPRPGEPPDAEELIALVRDRKGAIQTPKQVDFVESLPQTALGKIDKKVLRQQYWGNQERMVN